MREPCGAEELPRGALGLVAGAHRVVIHDNAVGAAGTRDQPLELGVVDRSDFFGVEEVAYGNAVPD